MKPFNTIGLILALGFIGLANTAASAEDAAASKTFRETNLARAKGLDTNRQRDFGNQTNFFLRPGLIADRTNRTVRVSAESIALHKGDPVEFQLITTGSGKDYEAQAVAFASAADIHQALEFIGLKPGQCINPAALRFWPKGDRIRMTFRYAHPASLFREVLAEQLVIDTRTGKTLPETGFVFTGSERGPAAGNGTGSVYSADAFSPGSIASLYNDPSTVMDVPRRASQNEVYTYQVPNPDLSLPPRALIEILLEPFYRDNTPHRFDYTLSVAPGKDAELVYSLNDVAGNTVNTNCTMNGLLATFGRLTSPDRDVFVVFRPDDSLTLKPMPSLAQVLSSLDTERGIRLEAPPEGHLYFKAFLPNQSFRRREDRPAAAAELYLSPHGTAITGNLVFVETVWKGDDTPATFTETRTPVPSPDKLAAALAAQEFPPSVMLIFAPESLSYGALRTFVAPLLKRHMILYVFRQD